MSNHGWASPAEAYQMAMKEPEAVFKSIDRNAAASMLGVTDRTLLRWHRLGYGPKRQRDWARRVYYIQAEVEGWIVENTAAAPSGIHDPRKSDIDCID
jgi:hypothetical protein